MTAPPLCRLPRGRRIELAPLVDATTGEPARLSTTVALADDGERLRLEILAADPHPWATLTGRDADLWTEEVVEVFLAPGEVTPRRYAEIEVNPLGALFDAWVDSPYGDRRELVVDRSWSCRGLEHRVTVDRGSGEWRVELTVPWRSVGPADAKVWRLNLYRIDRPLDAPPEHTAWSPTLIDPADFHRPARFGFLRRVG